MKIQLPEIKHYKRHPDNRFFGYTDTYGALKLLEDYCGQPITLKRHIDWFYWTHGCHGPWRMVHPALLTGNLQDKNLKYLVESKEQEAYLKSKGYKNAKAVGLPIIYVKDIEVERIPRSLLIMPSHTLQGNAKLNQAAYDNYTQFIQPYLKHFDVIKVCLHQGCIDNNMWTEEFASLGIDIIEGANPEDENALLRQKYLYNQFEYVTTNSWGSHVAYALFFNCKVSIIGPHQDRIKEDYLKDVLFSKNPKLLDLFFSENVISHKGEILKNLYTEPQKASADSDLGKQLVGQDDKKTPKQLLRIIKPKPLKVALFYKEKVFQKVKNKISSLTRDIALV